MLLLHFAELSAARIVLRRSCMGPHGKMLDAWFAEPGVAGAFVRAFLPPGAARLAVGEPELVPGSWVDDGLRGHLSDQLMRLRTLSVEQLARDTHLAGGLLALKAATTYENEKEALILEVVSRLRRERPSTTKTFISYFRRIAPRSARRALEAALQRLEGESMKTIDDVVFDRGHRKGLKKGLEKGREDGLRIALRSMLAIRFEKKITARTLARLEGADTSMLDRWIKKAAKARTLDAVFS